MWSHELIDLQLISNRWVDFYFYSFFWDGNRFSLQLVFFQWASFQPSKYIYIFSINMYCICIKICCDQKTIILFLFYFTFLQHLLIHFHAWICLLFFFLLFFCQGIFLLFLLWYYFFSQYNFVNLYFVFCKGTTKTCIIIINIGFCSIVLCSFYFVFNIYYQ